MQLCIAVSENAAESMPVVLRGALERVVPQAAQIGYKGLEVHLADPFTADPARFMRLCRENDMRVAIFATGSAYVTDNICLGHGDPQKCKQAVTLINAYTDLAAGMDGAMVGIGAIKGMFCDAPDAGTFYKNFESSLRECVAYAEKRNVKLTVECMNPGESDAYSTIAECAALIRAFASPSLTMYIDTYHMALSHEDVTAAVSSAADVIAYAQVSDSDRLCPDGSRLDALPMVQTLLAAGYDGFLSLECRPIPDALSAARNGYAYMESLLQQTGGTR